MHYSFRCHIRLRGAGSPVPFANGSYEHSPDSPSCTSPEIEHALMSI